jgi:nitric oxide reductase large subunit
MALRNYSPWLGANAMALAMKAKRVTIWKVFMVDIILTVIACLTRSGNTRETKDSRQRSFVAAAVSSITRFKIFFEAVMLRSSPFNFNAYVVRRDTP